MVQKTRSRRKPQEQNREAAERGYGLYAKRPEPARTAALEAWYEAERRLDEELDSTEVDGRGGRCHPPVPVHSAAA